MSQILADALRAHVYELSGKIGERSAALPSALKAARDYVRRTMSGYGYDPVLQSYTVQTMEFENVIASLPGSEGPRAPQIVIGAHYDTVPGTPGADDNASGVAGLLELARLMRGRPVRKALVFAAFSTEEPPFFGTRTMGSEFFAEELHREGRPVEGMVCLEMIGFFSKRPGVQSYPPFLKYFFPDRGDFIALVGNLRSRGFLQKIRAGLRSHMSLPLEHATLPAFVPGVDFSDHRSFWRRGIPAVMLTDTAFYRNGNYHGPADTHETLDYESMGALVSGLAKVLEDLTC